MDTPAGTNSHIHCVCHIINLGCKMYLKLIISQSKGVDVDADVELDGLLSKDKDEDGNGNNNGNNDNDEEEQERSRLPNNEIDPVHDAADDEFIDSMEMEDITTDFIEWRKFLHLEPSANEMANYADAYRKVCVSLSSLRSVQS
jgi:hypothetical protein